MTDYQYVQQNNPGQIKAALANGSVTVAIDAMNSVLMNYTGGVITSGYCGTNLDHAVVVVGYGKESNGQEYFLVRNSWGTGWGEAGYFKVGVSEGYGPCGINMYPTSAFTN